MKRLWLIIFLLVSFTITYGTSWAQSENQSRNQTEKAIGSKMVIKEKSFDFQKVDEGQVLQHSFKVHNEGDQPLLIQNVKPG